MILDVLYINKKAITNIYIYIYKDFQKEILALFYLIKISFFFILGK